MKFLNSPSTRIPLALVGGILYALLTYYILIFLGLHIQMAISGGIIVFLFYFGSRILIIFSGIDTLYYSKVKKGSKKDFVEKNHFYQTAQWVGKLYYYHDLFLLAFLGLVSLSFLLSIILDVMEGKPFGHTMQEFLNFLFSLYE